MTHRKLLIKQIDRAINHFTPQYPNQDIDDIRVHIWTSYDIMKMYVETENISFPTAEQIMDAARIMIFKVGLVSRFYSDKKEIEKYVDFLHIVSILILENWLYHLLPKQKKHPILERTGSNDNISLGWIFADQVLKEIFEKCNQKEKEMLSRFREAEMRGLGRKDHQYIIY